MQSKKTPLTLKRLRGILKQYGPPLRYNFRSEVGWTFLVECCRALYVQESVILCCVKELVEKHGASPNVYASCDVGLKFKGVNGSSGITPLCVAAARGMPSVVRYLIRAGADINLSGTGRFRLVANTMQSVVGTFTPLEFAEAVKEAELLSGLSFRASAMKDVVKCIRLLKREQQCERDTLLDVSSGI